MASTSLARIGRPARVGATALAVALLLGSCSGDDGEQAQPTTTTTTTPATTSTTTAPATTVPPPNTVGPPCPALSPPADPESVTEVEADVDGDGEADHVRSYRAGGWFVALDLARGGGADVEVPIDPGAALRVLGGADVDGDGGAEVWARTGSGASTTIVGLFRLGECTLTQVRFASGEPVELPVGGSVGSAAGVACEATSPDAHLTAYTALHLDAGRYEVTATEYALDGATLRPVGEPTTTTATTDDPAFARATTLTCDDLAL